MCRFYSGFFWRHPAIIQYDWIWRLDSDIVFHCDVVCGLFFVSPRIYLPWQPYDPFIRMQSAQALYGSILCHVSYFISHLSPKALFKFQTMHFGYSHPLQEIPLLLWLLMLISSPLMQIMRSRGVTQGRR
jgi:Glycolipid 2-alpha-mannosyltransferase